MTFGENKISLWSKNVNQEGKPLASSEIYLRVQATIKDVSPQVAYETMSDSDKRQSWDPRMQQVKKVSQTDNEVTQYYVVRSSVPFIATRDVVVRQQLMPNYPSEGEFAYAFSSTEDLEQCPLVPRFVRSENHLTGYRFKPCPEVNGTSMEWVQNIDVKGSIPEWIYRRSGVSMQVNVFRQMISAMEK